MGMSDPEMEGIPSHWMVYIAVADCDATAAKAGASGGKVVIPPTEIMVGKFACVADPQGAMFSIIQMNPTPPC